MEYLYIQTDVVTRRIFDFPDYATRGALTRGMLILALIVMLIPACAGRASSTPSLSSSKIAYDTASIRRCGPGLNEFRIEQTADSFIAKCAQIGNLIAYAYPMIMPGRQLTGLPKWSLSTSFNIDAKMDDEAMAKLSQMTDDKQTEERRLMLQALLAKRFNLRLHSEFQECSAYDLVITNSGPKLKQAEAGEGAGSAGRRAGLILVRGRPMEDFIRLLSNVVGRPVVDKTGLTGKYDIRLRYLPPIPLPTESDAPSIFTALQETLGLKLLPSKTQLKIFVVDHVEQPSPN